MREEVLPTGKRWTAIELQPKFTQSQRELESYHGPSEMSPFEVRPLHPHFRQLLNESYPQGKGILLGELTLLAKGITEEGQLYKLLVGNSFATEVINIVWLLFFKNLLRCVSWPKMLLTLLNCTCELVKNVYSDILGWNSL